MQTSRFKRGDTPEMPINDTTSPIFEKDFFEALSEVANMPEQKGRLINMVIINAQNGDPSALKILEKAMSEGRFSEEKKIRITNEQFRKIIRLAAERLTD